MLNKLPIGQVAKSGEVGTGSGNDKQNRDSMDRARVNDGGGITLDRKRPRYSIVAMAVNGPNSHQPVGAFDMLGNIPAAGVLDVDSASFRPATNARILFEHKMREPMIFLGGSLFIGDDSTDTPSNTTVAIYKNSLTEPYKIEERKFPNGPNTELVDGQVTRYFGDVLIDLPGARTYFATDEVFIFYVQPDTDSGDSNTDGLVGVSALLWFKSLHM